MEQLEHGIVESVAEVAAGDELVTAALAGATTLSLGDAVDFAEDGGTLAIGAEVLAYSSADLDADTVVLADPTTEDYEVGEPVLVYPPAPERVATVLLDEDGEAVDARVPHALYDRVPEGIREANLGERVSLTLDGAAWVVADVLGKEPLIDGTYVDLTGTELPGGTDGLPPGFSPTPTVLGGVGVLHVRWAGIANPDAVTYDVHLSTSDGFTPDGSTLAAQTPSTALTLRTLPDGTPLAYDTTYYVRLVATDPDPGEAPASAQGSAQLHRVSNTEISAEYAYLGNLSADAITTGTLDAAVTVSGEVKTSDSGRRVVMDALGLHLFSSANVPLVDLPTDTSKRATFTGDAEMENLTIKGTLALEAPGNVSVDGGLELSSGTIAPTTAPSVTLDHEVGATPFAVKKPDNFYPSYGTYASVQGLAYSSAHAYLLVMGASGYEVQRFPRDGGAHDAYLSLDTFESETPYGIAVDPATSNVWVVFYDLDTDGFNVRCWPSTLAGAPLQTVTPPGDGTYVLGIAVHAGTVYVGKYHPGNGVWHPRVTSFPTSGGASTHYTTTATSYGIEFTGSKGFAAGTFDFGDGVVRFAWNVNGTVRMFTVSGTSLVKAASHYDFATGMDSNIGGGTGNFTYDTTSGQFRQVGYQTVYSGGVYADGEFTGGVLAPVPWKRFTGIKWTTESATWWASYGWRNGAAKTDQGKRASFTMQQRYRARLDSASLPASPTSAQPAAVDFYLGRGSTEPARTAMWQQGGTLANGVTTLTLTSATFSGTNPPASNTFAGGGVGGYVRSASKRQDGTPKTNIDGLGAANVDGLLPPGSITMWAGGTTPPTGWALCNGAVRNTATSPDLFAAIGYTFGGSGTSFNLPNFNDRMPLGAGGARSSGATGGSETTTLVAGNLPPHTHNINRRVTSGSGGGVAHGGGVLADDTTTGNGPGSSDPFSVLSPFLAIRFIIKL